TMPNTRSGETMKREAVNELIARRVAEARNGPETLNPLWKVEVSRKTKMAMTIKVEMEEETKMKV
nr:hypothetical protein [Tanacetum cinerariifolium]